MMDWDEVQGLGLHSTIVMLCTLAVRSSESTHNLQKLANCDVTCSYVYTQTTFNAAGHQDQAGDGDRLLRS